MKIRNINDVKKYANQITVLIFIVIFTSASFALMSHYRFQVQRKAYNDKLIIEQINNSASDLSEKLSIIASSTVFLDYLRSGETTREKLYTQLLAQLSTLKNPNVTGMRIIDNNGKTIFDYGKHSGSYVALNLCYLNQTLDPEMGFCNHTWKLYFDHGALLRDILKLNNSLKSCVNCKARELVNNGYFGSFPVADKNKLDFKIQMAEQSDYFFYVYFLLMSLSLVIFSCWCWYRLSDILNNYIAHPIKNLAKCLSADEVIEQSNDIDEIKYLVGEINTWKNRINKTKEDEHGIKLGKIAAQLAHDVRSPIMVMDMVIKNITQIPENHKNMLQQAAQRIADIAGGFLVYYRDKGIADSEIKNENVLVLLQAIIKEKQLQYSDKSVNISFTNTVTDNYYSNINASDFNRVISNIINNAAEAIEDEGKIDINLFRKDAYLCLSIVDNGRGISPDVLPHIFEGKSVGKVDGSGLGLSHAKMVIEGWNGRIHVDSIQNKGTQAIIYLPCVI